MTITRNRTKRAKISTTLAVLLAAGAWALGGCKEKDQPPIPAWKSGTTVIPGTFGWDAEGDAIVSPDNADLWWEMVAEAERYLTPRNGARAAIVKHKTYDELTARHLERWHMPDEKLPATGTADSLSPGTVVAFRTAEGIFGKLKIVGFRPLHDLSFPEASVYSEQWRSQAAGRPNDQRYHLEIEWALYQPAPPR